MSASNTRRRLSLLTGSSMFAAMLMAGAGGVVFAPTAALAANECGNPNANTTGADTFVCTGTHTAITYPLTNGTLTLQLQNNVTTTTGGLVVVGTGTNAVTISRIADSPANSGDPSLSSTSATDAALQVTRATAGGNISVNLSDNDTADTALVISGVKGGVLLSNMGTNTTAFTTTNGTITASAGHGIELTTSGTGALTLTNGSAVTGTTAGARLRTTGTGAMTVTNNGGLTATAGAGLDLGTTGTGNITVTNNGVANGTSAAVSVAGGNNVTLTNNGAGQLVGAMTFTNTGVTTINNNGRWTFGGASTLRDTATATGSTTLTNSASGTIAAGLDGVASSINFGIGAATFTNAGTLAAGHGTEGGATLTLANLAAWNNSGKVLFGADDMLFATDGAANDRIVLTRVGGGTFTGSGASQLVMDVDFGASQMNCAAAVTADCLDLRGQNTAGTTSVRVNTVGFGSGTERIVLVDAGGAGTDAGTFTLDANSTGYRDADGGLVDGGLFLYALQHDDAAKQHILTAVSADGEAFELALIGRQASEPWRTATGMWHDRQADLRNTIAGRAEGYAPGAWLKIAGNFVGETRIDGLDIGGDTLEFNTTYDQRTTAIVGGVDLLRFIGENSAWVLGLTAGQLESSVDYETAQSVVDLEGQSFGGYASVLAGPAFFDAIINATNLDLTHNGFGGEVEGAVKSIGYQLEGGYRLFRINEDGPWVEPLGSLTYVSTTVEDLVMGGATTSFEDASSLRGALGLRLGGDLVMDSFTTSFSATGRLWKEFDGDNASTISAVFGDTDLMDEGMDNLGDLGVAASFFTLGGRLSAHLAYNMLFQEDYQNTGASFGLRYNW